MNRISTNLATIFGQIKSQLISEADFNTNTVYIGIEPVATDLEPSLTYAIITPGSQSVINPESDEPLVKGSFTVSILSYLNLDQANRAGIALTDDSLSITAIAQNVIGSLHLYDLLDPDVGFPILACPIHFREWGEPTEIGKGWKRLDTTFEIIFSYDIANTPVAGTRITTNPMTIFSQIQSHLIDLELFNSNTVYLGLDPDTEDLEPSTVYAVITPGRQQVIDPETIAPTIEGSFSVSILSYLNLDQANRYDIALTDSVGILDFADQVIAGLHLYDLTDPNTDAPILACPLHFTDLKDIRDKGNWKQLTASFDFVYGYSIGVAPSQGAFDSAFSNAFN